MSKDLKNTTQVEDPAMAPVTNEELLALYTSQGEVIAEQQKQILELTAKLAEVAAQAKDASAPKGGTIVKVGKVEYQVMHGLRVAGQVLTPADIAANKELCEKLVADQSGALKKL